MKKEELDLLLAQDPLIPREMWGIEGTKSEAELLDEVEEGETVLGFEYVPDILRQGLVRDTCVLLLSIYFELVPNIRSVLVETKHVLADGYVFSRADEMNASASEKVKAHETREEAVLRLLAEELQISGLTEIERRSIHFFDSSSFKMSDTRIEEDLYRSRSYPGVWTRQRIIRASIELSTRHYRPEGYIERVYDKQGVFLKDVHFAWMSQEEALRFAGIIRETKRGQGGQKYLRTMLAEFELSLRSARADDP